MNNLHRDYRKPKPLNNRKMEKDNIRLCLAIVAFILSIISLIIQL